MLLTIQKGLKERLEQPKLKIVQLTDRAKHTKRVRRAKLGLRLFTTAVVAVGAPCIARILATEVHAANDEGGPNMALPSNLWATMMMIIFMRMMKIITMTSTMITSVISSIRTSKPNR